MWQMPSGEIWQSEMQNVNCPSQEKAALISFDEPMTQVVAFRELYSFMYILFGIYSQTDI